MYFLRTANLVLGFFSLLNARIAYPDDQVSVPLSWRSLLRALLADDLLALEADRPARILADWSGAYVT